MNIEQISFAGPLGTLRGLLHRPDSDSPVPVIVLLHGFTGQHIEQDRLFVQMAHQLTAAGFAVLRFDFYGSGDSDGEFDEFTVETEVADAIAALDWLEQQPGLDMTRIGVLGLSLGGYVTALLAGREPRVKAVVFWNAVALPSEHFNDQAFLAEMVGGLQIGPDFLPVFYASDPVGSLRCYTGPGLVIQAAKDEVIALAEAAALKEALGERGTLHHIEGADHTFRHPEWRRQVFEITVEWLRKHLSRP